MLSQFLFPHGGRVSSKAPFRKSFFMKLNRAGRSIVKKAMVGLGSRNSLLKKFAVHAVEPAIQQDVLSRKQVWQCCTPKSASTFLNRILSALWRQDVCSGPPVPYWRDRMQEPDPISVYRCMSRSIKPYFSGHLHQKFNSYLFERFLKYQQEFRGGNRSDTGCQRHSFESQRNG